MGISYGSIVVSQSDDFKADFEALCGALNSFDGWDAEGNLFELCGGLSHQSIWFTVEDCKNPSVVLKQRKTNGSLQQVSMDEIGKLISNHIQSGTLVVAVAASQKNRLVDFQSLTVHADGRCERFSSGVHSWGFQYTENEASSEAA